MYITKSVQTVEWITEDPSFQFHFKGFRKKPGRQRYGVVEPNTCNSLFSAKGE